MNLPDHQHRSHHKTNNPPAKQPWLTGLFAAGALSLTAVAASAAVVTDSDPSLLTAFAFPDAAFSLSTTVESPTANAPLISLATYARAGWQTTLSTRAHGVRGTVTIVDADTFRVDNFFYDGGGIDVHFIVAAADDNNTFRTARLVTDLNLLGTAHSGDSITIDLPTGSTFDGYNAISVWCIPAGANFGSGTFVNTAPEPTSVGLLGVGLVTMGWFARRRISSQP